MAEGPKVRLGRCPKCRNLLPELPEYSVYQCGGRSTVVRGTFGAVFASIPAPILYCLFFAYVGARGLSFLQFCNLNNFRTKFIRGFLNFMGLSVPQYFNEYTAINIYGPVHTGAQWFNDVINVPFQSKGFVASCLAYFLDNTLHKKDGSIRKDR